jgi:endonuclease/exonuclease/phosphatase family metal-dependent hydrolase
MARRRKPHNRELQMLVEQFLRLPRALQIAIGVAGVVLILVVLLRQPDAPAPVGPPGPGGPGSYLFCFWNVENLFDDIDDPRNTIDNPYDDAFAADDVLRLMKYDRLSNALLRMNGGIGPDIIACVEVESVRAAELLMRDLNSKIPDPSQHYTVLAMKNLSAGRHIAPCVISRVGLRPEETRLHGRNLRILETRLVSNGHELTIITSHWTSQLRGGESGRERYAETIRDVVDNLTARDPYADVLVCGDFNDTPDSEPVQRVMRTTGDRAKVIPGSSLMLNLLAGKPADRYGTLWYREPLIYDQICISPGLLDNRGWSCDPDSIAVVTDGLIRPGATRRQPWRFGSPDDTLKPADRGYSDHFPVTVRLSVQSALEP